MGDEHREIREAVRKLAGTHKVDRVEYFMADVDSVDEDAATCVVILKGNAESIKVPNVQLQSGVCDGLLIVPTVGSEVKVITSIHNDPFVAQFSDIDKVYLQVGDSAYLITNDGKHKLNDGSYGGLIRIDNLIKDINDTKHLVNNLLSTLKGISVALAPSGNYPFAPFFSGFNSLPDSTKPGDNGLENPDITHGPKPEE